MGAGTHGEELVEALLLGVDSGAARRELEEVMVGSTVYPNTTDIRARILLLMHSDLQHEASWSI